MRLGDVATYVNGYAFKPSDWSDTGVPIIRIQDLTGNAYQANRYNGEYSSKYEVNSGDVLISWSASLGVYVWTGETAVLNQHIFKVIFDKATVNKSFFVHQVQRILDEAASEAHGATMKHLTKPVFDALPFYLPSINRQDEIAAVLDKISNLIDLHKQQLEKLDELVKSRFIELFGDTETNPMSWPIVSIGSTIASCEAGWSGNGQQRQKKPGEIAVLKVSAVTKGYFIQEECKVLDDQANIKKYVFPQKGDLLFSRANTREMVGATAVITEDFPELILPDKLWKIRFTEAANTWYMKYILSSKTVRDRFSAASTGTSGSMYNISMEKFKTVQIPMPSLELQNEFAAFAEQVDKSKLYGEMEVAA
jgi:type I restriction enzyme S subunit